MWRCHDTLAGNRWSITKKVRDMDVWLNKLYLLMEKQQNRGQEGAGLVYVKLGSEPRRGNICFVNGRSVGAITEIFGTVQSNFKDSLKEQLHDAGYAKKKKARALPLREVYMGHLRYSTTGKSGISYVHPFSGGNNWRAKNLCPVRQLQPDERG